MNKTFSISLLMVALLGASSVMAAPQDRRAKCQASPMREAILSGALTDAELKTLEADRAAIRERYRALRQADQPLDDKARAELRAMRDKLHAKAQALAANAERGPARSAPPASFCGPRGGKHHGGMQPPPASLSPAQRAQWQQDREALRSKVQAARADGKIDEGERNEIRALHDTMQRKYHAASQAQ